MDTAEPVVVKFQKDRRVGLRGLTVTRDGAVGCCGEEGKREEPQESRGSTEGRKAQRGENTSGDYGGDGSKPHAHSRSINGRAAHLRGFFVGRVQQCGAGVRSVASASGGSQSAVDGSRAWRQTANREPRITSYRRLARSNSSSVFGQSVRRRRESARSASRRPPVWHAAQ